VCNEYRATSSHGDGVHMGLRYLFGISRKLSPCVCQLVKYRCLCELWRLLTPCNRPTLPKCCQNLNLMRPEDGQDNIVEGYDPAYEWPGDQLNDDDGQLGEKEYSPQASSKSAHGRPVFRFVTLRSSILPSKQKVAILDSYFEVQIGRDAAIPGSVTPRIRLKELEVSKLHATAYWDGARKEWNVVDMGSKHGTWLLHAGTQVGADASSSDLRLGVRLSPPRVASIPRQLRHSDHLSIGGTTLVVHIHEDQRPCHDCTISDNGTEIPLFPLPKNSAVKRTRDTAGLESDASSDRDPKKALTMLKRSLLTRHEVSKFGSNRTVTNEKSNEYVDRAALRRFLRPASGPDAPGIRIASPIPSNALCSPSSQNSTPCVSTTTVSQPPTPLPTSNIGHRLLMKQGWTPGDTLGVSDPLEDRVGLVEPLEVKSIQNRAGLGIKSAVAVVSVPDISGSGITWKERERIKRFAALR
jgi:pSer/pThr/pTyr-binding forkhead associated (FHA) protein